MRLGRAEARAVRHCGQNHLNPRVEYFMRLLVQLLQLFDYLVYSFHASAVSLTHHKWLIARLPTRLGDTFNERRTDGPNRLIPQHSYRHSANSRES